MAAAFATASPPHSLISSNSPFNSYRMLELNIQEILRGFALRFFVQESSGGVGLVRESGLQWLRGDVTSLEGKALIPQLSRGLGGQFPKLF